MGAIRADRAGISAGDVFTLISDDLVHTRADIGRATDLSRTAVFGGRCAAGCLSREAQGPSVRRSGSSG